MISTSILDKYLDKEYYIVYVLYNKYAVIEIQRISLKEVMCTYHLKGS